MHLAIKLLTFTALSLAIPAMALAGEAPLPLTEYQAEPAPLPPLKQRLSERLAPWSGIYLVARVGSSFTNSGNITSSGTIMPNAPVAKDNINKAVADGAVGIGYTFRPNGGIFSRLELEYLRRGNVDYNVSPIFAGGGNEQKIASAIKNQTLMVKIHNDLDLGATLIPYFSVDLGLSQNDVTGSSNYSGTVSKIDNSSSHFAWGLGLGTRYQVTQRLFLDLNYEYTALGRLTWNFNGADNNIGSLHAKNYASNTVNLGIMWQF